MSNLNLRAAGKFLQLPVIFALFVFLLAGTLNYWQGWLFSAVFAGCSLALTLYLAVADPQLLERRMKVGPGAEKEPTQKIIMIVALLAFAAMPVLSAIDHRLSWSSVPASVAIFGNILIVLAYVGFYLMFRENTYGAATIQVAEGQRVISTGPYAVVRHPMYSWALLMMLGMPLASVRSGACLLSCPASPRSWRGCLTKSNFWPAVCRDTQITCAVSGIAWCLGSGEPFYWRLASHISRAAMMLTARNNGSTK